MSRRYGTRAATKAARIKAARSRDPTAGNPLASEQRHNPEALEAAPPPRTNSGRTPLASPSPFHLAVDAGQQRGQEPTPPSAAPASALVPSTAGGPQIGAENHPPSAGESRRKRSRLSLSKRRAPSSQHTVVAPAVLAPVGGSKSGSSGAVVGCFPGGISPRLSESCVGSARHPPHTSPPPPPPFVGLKNVGETCYMNAVLQSLAACRAAHNSSRSGASGAAGNGGKAGYRQEAHEGLGSSSAAPARATDDVGLSSADTVSTGVRAGTDGNPVFYALGKVLGEMEARNRMLFQQQSPETPLELSIDPEISVLAGNGSPERPMHPSEQTPLAPGVPTREGVCAGVMAPNALVELVRGGWLSAERATGGVSLVRHLGGSPAVGDFGSGQACVSELLGKILDVCAATAAAAGAVQDGGELGDASSGGVVGEQMSCDSGGVCSLATAFRGTLCAHTRCVECERGRTSREEFTELTLPPLVLPPRPPAQPPSPKRAAAAQGAVASVGNSSGDPPKFPQEAQTLQSLVDAMLGRESLEGNNKVWCEACRQWNEAERRSSLCSPPSLLALHVRPGARKQSSPCTYPAAAIVAAGGAFKKQVNSAGGAGGRGGQCKTEQGLTAHDGVNGNGELIERVLVVKGAVRCQSHVAEASGNGSTSSAPARKSQQPRDSTGHRRQEKNQHYGQPSDSGDVLYDLIGAILHQGQTLGSGHYTFALHAGGSASRFRAQAPTNHHHHPPSAGGRSSASGGTENAAPSAGGTDRGSPGSALVQGLIGGGEAGGSVAGGTRCTKPAFALFDDDVVRWLSLEEESAVLRGGGAAIGDPFLVFYARRN